MAGVAGKMILSVSLDRDGYLFEIHAVESLSPGLDKAGHGFGAPMEIEGLPSDSLCGDRNFRCPSEKLTFRFIFPRFCDPLSGRMFEVVIAMGTRRDLSDLNCRALGQMSRTGPILSR